MAGVLFIGAPPVGDNPSASELLPPPALVAPGMPGPSPYAGYFRTNRYDVWQYVSVDRQGYWRPRVVYSPYGSYYLYNGQPFPWTETHPREWEQYILDTPNP
jgi:hypothetical protein